MAEALFHYDDVLWQRFERLCKTCDETPGAVLRDLVRLGVQRCVRREARSAEGIDERLLVQLRLLVAAALAISDTRSQLQSALRVRGLRYVPSGGGLVLAEFDTERKLVKFSQIGPAYMALARRFGAGFPGHPQPGIAAKALARP